MLPIELLSERFKNHFKLCWPFSNSTLEIEWIRRENTLYLRPKNAHTEILWICPVAQTQGSRIVLRPVTVLENALRQKRIWRYCLFQEQAIFINHTEGIIASSTAKILHASFSYSLQSRYPLGAAFQLPPSHFDGFQKQQKYLLAPPELIETGLNALQKGESSDFNRARRWLLSYHDEWALIDWDEATRNKVMALLRALYWMYGNDETDYSYELRYFALHQNNLVVVINPNSLRWTAPQKLFDAINQHFQLHLIDRRRAFISTGWCKPSRSFPNLSFSFPTMHEKLEAFCLWQEFLSDKLEPSEIEAILPSL